MAIHAVNYHAKQVRVAVHQTASVLHLEIHPAAAQHHHPGLVIPLAFVLALLDHLMAAVAAAAAVMGLPAERQAMITQLGRMQMRRI